MVIDWDESNGGPPGCLELEHVTNGGQGGRGVLSHKKRRLEGCVAVCSYLVGKCKDEARYTLVGWQVMGTGCNQEMVNS